MTGLGDTMKISAKLTILLLLLITILIIGVVYIFFFNTTEKQIYNNMDIYIPFSELKITEKHNSYGDNFSHDGESLYLITSKKDLKSATKKMGKITAERNSCLPFWRDRKFNERIT